MKAKYAIIAVVLIVVTILVATSTYIVEEHEQVVITQFGKPVGEAITEPGLYFKVPFIQKTNFFEKRFMEWNGAPNQVTTKEKKFIFISSYARWHITDPLKYLQRMKDEKKAHARIDDILDGETKTFIAKNNLLEIVRSTNREPIPLDTTLNISEHLPKISKGRQNIQQAILKAARLETADLGITIRDFRFKRIDYDLKVKDRVYNRMMSDRKKIASDFRSKGQGEARKINSQRKRDLDSITSTAYKIAEDIMGEADARAAAIYASAYNKSFQAKELYAFLKSLETFEKTIDAKTSLILSTDSELYRYLKGMN